MLGVELDSPVRVQAEKAIKITPSVIIFFVFITSIMILNKITKIAPNIHYKFK